MRSRFFRGDFARHGALVFASSMLVNALNYVFHLLITRRLGVDSYGALYSLLAAMTLLSVPTTVLGMVVVRYAAEFHALNDRARLASLTSWLIRRTSLAAAAIVALGLAFQMPVAAYLRLGDPRAVVAAAFVLALGIVAPTVRAILQGMEAFRPFSISMLVEGSGKALFGVGLVYAGFGVNGALAGYGLAMLLGLGYTYIAVRRQIPRAHEPLRIDARRLVQTTTGVMLAMLALNALGSMDLLLVKHYFSPYDAGLYSAVSLVGKVLLFVVGFIPTIVLPKATARVTRGESPVGILLQAGAAIAFLCIGGLVALDLAPSLVVRLMSGVAFLGASPYVLSYGFAMAMLGATTVVVTYKIGLHRFDFLAPILSIAILEILAISRMHGSLGEVIRIVLVGHTLCFVSSLYRVTYIVPQTYPQQAHEAS